MSSGYEYSEKFKKLMEEILQFDCTDLDFGIYKILNKKRTAIKDFIEKSLPEKVSSAFETYEGKIKREFEEKLSELKSKIADTFGPEAFDQKGNLIKYHDTPLGKQYTIKKAEYDKAILTIEEVKKQVYNDLYQFFSRYYEDGDFIPLRRRKSGKYVYSIPYNGEEVKLYWATHDMYYVKTGEYFKNYVIKLDDKEISYRLIFQTISATTEVASNKATKDRYFILDNERPFEIEGYTLKVNFNYRELTEEERDLVIKSADKTLNSRNEGEENLDKSEYESKKKKGDGIKQEHVNEFINKEIINYLEKREGDPDDIKNTKIYLLEALKKTVQTSTGNEKPLLLYHLNRYTAKNTKDYFIHKNLKGFLNDQLDYYIKSEVIDLETIQTTQLETVAIHSIRASLVKEIGEYIIDLLSQIEDFQKKLWEIKKFVVKTDYVITLDRIRDWCGLDYFNKVVDLVWENKNQKDEWRELGFEFNQKEELYNSKLPIDTKHFDEQFKYELLEKITEKHDLDEALDGILIKSENWQALNTILNKYKGKIRTIYIDPPYNTGNDGFLYRDRYKHSSWLSMMENRLSLARELMRDDGVIFVSIGDLNPQEGESFKLQLLESSIFDRRFGNLIWKKRGGIGSFSEKNMTENHEYITVYGNQKSFIYHNILSESKRKEYKNEDEIGLYRWMDLIGPSQQTKEKRPNLNYGIIYDETADKIIGFEYFKNNKEEKDFFDEFHEGHEIVSIWLPGEATWLISKEVLKEYYKRGLVKVFKSKGGYRVKIKNYLYNESGLLNGDILKSILTDNDLKIGLNIEATKELQSLFPSKKNIIDRLNPKPVSLVKLLIHVTTIHKEIILDFFAGSGTTAHAVMKLNNEDGGKRKFILVEMADYFDTIIIPRLKKVAYSFNWKDGKPQDNEGIGVFFKYQYLEQYEDALDNIELRENNEMKDLFGDQYLLKYFLNVETRDSEYFLNIENLKDPFSYKMRINLSEVGNPQVVTVDIPETFNYVMGIKVKKVKRKENYLFVLGEKNSETCAIVWRPYNDNWDTEDFTKDNETIIENIKEWKPEVLYINGQSAIAPESISEFKLKEVRYIEPIFKEKILKGVENA